MFEQKKIINNYPLKSRYRCSATTQLIQQTQLVWDVEQIRLLETPRSVSEYTQTNKQYFNKTKQVWIATGLKKQQYAISKLTVYWKVSLVSYKLLLLLWITNLKWRYNKLGEAFHVRP